MQKNKKHLGQGMEAHNLIGRGSWTHVQIKTKYVQQTNRRNMKSKRLTLLMVNVKVLLQTKLLKSPPKLQTLQLEDSFNECINHQ
jgi:hypothetical protein